MGYVMKQEGGLAVCTAQDQLTLRFCYILQLNVFWDEDFSVVLS